MQGAAQRERERGHARDAPRNRSVPHFYRDHNPKKTSCTSPAERPRARRDSDGTGLCSPIMHATLAAMRPIEARVGLHEDGCRAVLVSAMRTTNHLVGAPPTARAAHSRFTKLERHTPGHFRSVPFNFLKAGVKAGSRSAPTSNCCRAPSTPTCW